MYSVQQSWYQNKKWLVLLWPLSLLFRFIAWLRRHFLVTVARKSPHPRPVVIIGNISVGGTGKTPLLIRLAGELTKAGLRPGIVSRGYGGKPSHYPLFVSPQSDPAECGDEALLIAQQTDCPLMVDPDRERAYQALCAQYECDVVLSDDGLQHYGLKRDIEVAVVDGQRLFGNGFCLPAGPLREPPKRLAQVQYVVLNDPPVDKSNSPYLQNAISMKVKPRFLVNLLSDEKKPFNGAPFNMGATIHAVSGIGNPDRFVALLESLPYNLQRHDFADHHSFTEMDLDAIDEHQPIVMTEKDAVKCKPFAKSNHWYLSTEVELPREFIAQFVRDVKQLAAGNSGKKAKKKKATRQQEAGQKDAGHKEATRKTGKAASDEARPAMREDL